MLDLDSSTVRAARFYLYDYFRRWDSAVRLGVSLYSHEPLARRYTPSRTRGSIGLRVAITNYLSSRGRQSPTSIPDIFVGPDGNELDLWEPSLQFLCRLHCPTRLMISPGRRCGIVSIILLTLYRSSYLYDWL